MRTRVRLEPNHANHVYFSSQSAIEQSITIDWTPLIHVCACVCVFVCVHQIDTKGLASSIVSSGADTTSNLFRKFKDTTSSAKSKTDQVSDSATHQAQAAWQDTKTTTKEVASKTKQKANQAAKNAQQSANFLGKQKLSMVTLTESDQNEN